MGMDYWRTATIGYGTGGNNHEAGASNWYFPSDQWQEAVFTDIGGPQFLSESRKNDLRVASRTWPW
jgi:hypothetical protein